jgi:hypothetical protein
MDRGERVNKELQELLGPYFLQRLKIDFLKDTLPNKTELVVWTHLSTEQRRMYTEFIGGNSLVRSILAGENTTVLEAITWLKKLCGHPILVKNQDPDTYFDSYGMQEAVEQSSKLDILVHLIDCLCSQNHRVLVFSQSTKMLDVIEKVLVKVNVSRIDGGTKERDRQRRVDAFNDENSSIEVMLLSTKAAGVGLTLTGADRVVVYDPSWNPAEDSQAVDRCYRIGQTREVVVYRLIAAGTVEEKMYEKQIHKDGIRRTVFTTGASVQRYFVRDELSKMLSLAPAGECETMLKVQEIKTNWSQQQFILSHRGVVGLSRHDGFYRPSGPDKEGDGPKPAFPATSTPMPALKGKSQRILQSLTSRDKPHPFGEKLNTKPGSKRVPPKERTWESFDHSTDFNHSVETKENYCDLKVPSIIEIDIDDDDPVIPVETVHSANYTLEETDEQKSLTSRSGQVMQGKSKRILQNSSKREETIPPEQKMERSSKTVHIIDSTRETMDHSGTTVHIESSSVIAVDAGYDDGDTAESAHCSAGGIFGFADIPSSNDYNRTGVAECNGKKEASSVGVEQPISEILAQAENFAMDDKPNRALCLLMDVIDNRYDEVDKSFKLAFHNQVAAVAGSLGLLSSATN